MTEERAPQPSPEQTFIDNARTLVVETQKLIAKLPSIRENRFQLETNLNLLKATRDTREFWEQKGRKLGTTPGNPLEPGVQQNINDLTALKPKLEEAIAMAEEWLKESAAPVESPTQPPAAEPVRDVPPVEPTPEPQPQPEPQVETQPKTKTPDEVIAEGKKLFAEAAGRFAQGEWTIDEMRQVMSGLYQEMNQAFVEAFSGARSQPQPESRPQPEPEVKSQPQPPRKEEAEAPVSTPEPGPTRDTAERVREAVGGIAEAVGAAWAEAFKRKKGDEPQTPGENEAMNATQPVQVKENRAAEEAAKAADRAATAEVKAVPEEPVRVAPVEEPVVPGSRQEEPPVTPPGSPPAPKSQPAERSATQPTAETTVVQEPRITNLEEALGLKAAKSVDNGVADRVLATLNKALTNPDWDVLEDLIYDQGIGVVLLTRGSDQDLLALETALSHKTAT